MRFLDVLASLLGVASLTQYVAADLRIKEDYFSFGGVNYPGLQILEPEERDDVIRKIVKSGARVIRLFIQGNEVRPDPELELGSFDPYILEMFDDTMGAIHRISKGKVKVIISPHNAHALRKTNGVPCDAYCQQLDGAFLDFYSNEEIRQKYKTRLGVFFTEFPSRNFQGRKWKELNEIILGVDLQNEPWSGIWPIVSGETWLCDIANYLKDDIGLGESGIAVITGGISGAQTPEGIENYPDSAFNCPGVDVIGIHGYFSMDHEKTAGTNWANIFLPGNTLTSRALGKKLLMVEEMSYVHTKLGHAYKKQAIWDQGNALNYRGIPWLYSHLSLGGEGMSAAVSVDREDSAAIGALKDILRRAYVSRSNFDWSKYISAPPALSNATHVATNPYIHEFAECTFGCLGHLCDAADGCKTDLICKNSICTIPSESQPGNVGAECNSKQLCQEHLRCEDETCQECIERPSIQPKDKRKRAVPGHVNFQCQPDSTAMFNMRPFCLKPQPFGSPLKRGNPCEKASHCDANEYCYWGFCKPCTGKDGCLGAKCKSNNKCKTGYCNSFGHCDYPGLVQKKGGPGARAGGMKRSPVGPGMDGNSGPQKVIDRAFRAPDRKETPEATGKPVPT